MDVYFNIDDTTSPDEADVFLYEVFRTKQKVILHINLTEYSRSYFDLFVFKKVLDTYREYSKKYIMYTNITINNTFVALILELLLLFFKPENPVFFDQVLSDRQSHRPTRTLCSGP
jgi:hypothetical protein